MTEDRKARDDHDRDERVTLPADPETALRALLQVDPDSEPVEQEGSEPTKPKKLVRRPTDGDV